MRKTQTTKQNRLGDLTGHRADINNPVGFRDEPSAEQTNCNGISASSAKINTRWFANVWNEIWTYARLFIPSQKNAGGRSAHPALVKGCGDFLLGSIKFTGFHSTYIHWFSNRGRSWSPLHGSRDWNHPSAVIGPPSGTEPVWNLHIVHVQVDLTN